jgi:hypothetical protein
LQIRKTKATLANLAINTSKQKATEDRITMMITTVVGIFVACNSFQAANNACQAYMTRPPNAMFVLSYFVAVVNSSLNSVAYGIFSKKYREVFFEHFFCKKQVQAKNLSSVTTKN